MQITMYIYSQQLPINRLTMYHCLKCKRPLFEASSEAVVISNARGASFEEYPPGSHYIEHQCHSCKSIYKILFQ